MQRVRRIEHHRRRSGAGEGGRNLSADVSGFTYSHDNDLASRIDCFLDQFNGSGEIFAETFPQSLELKNFYVQDTFGLFKVVHRSIYNEGRCCDGQEFARLERKEKT